MLPREVCSPRRLSCAALLRHPLLCPSASLSHPPPAPPSLSPKVDRPNFGLTLDVGHCIMAGENPAQSAAMVGARGKLFGVQLNDGHSRLAAEDGLMFGSVHRSMALELMLWLRRTRFDGHLYFDTFPRNEDAITEAEYNIRAARALWAKAGRLEAASVQKRVLAPQDAMAALELLDEMERPLREELED